MFLAPDLWLISLLVRVPAGTLAALRDSASSFFYLVLFSLHWPEELLGGALGRKEPAATSWGSQIGLSAKVAPRHLKELLRRPTLESVL